MKNIPRRRIQDALPANHGRSSQTATASLRYCKKGIPVVKLVPVEDTERNVFGCLEGVVEIVGDIEAPV